MFNLDSVPKNHGKYEGETVSDKIRKAADNALTARDANESAGEVRNFYLGRHQLNRLLASLNGDKDPEGDILGPR